MRHAESEWNAAGRLQGQADPPLSELGRQQAARAAARLVDEGVDAIVASDLRRACETADSLAQALSMKIEKRRGLREVDLGSWTGASRFELEERDPESWRRWREEGIEGWEGGERYVDAMKRIEGDLAEVAHRHQDKTVVAVTHGGCVRLATCHLLGMASESFGRIASIGNASITEFQVQPDRTGRLVRLNDTAHLLLPTASDDLDPGRA